MVDGDEVSDAAWPSRRSAELVQLLALSDRHRLMREQVIEALWPHLEPDAGAANLRKAAHHARQALRPGGRGGVERRPGRRCSRCEVETDVGGFERRAEAAAALAGRCRVRRGVARLRRVTCSRTRSTRSGPSPGGISCDPVTSRCCGSAGDGSGWSRSTLPTSRPTASSCARALAAGNRHAAIRWYGRLRTNLERELGLPPEPESRALYEECVAGLGPAATVFVGRQAELARVAAGLRSAERGELGALVVRGPAGIGKSTLCRQVAASARERGWLAVTVAATPDSGPYASLVAAVEQLLGHDRSLLDALPAPARSTLAALTALAAPAQPHEGGLTRHMVIGAVRRLIAACPDVTGVLLVVDDAHLADDATVEAWGHLARAGGGLPFLGVLAFRPERGPPALTRTVAGLDRAGRVRRDRPGPARPRRGRRAGGGGRTAVKPAAGVLARIVEMAQGNPFFALELARGIGRRCDRLSPPSVWDAITERFLDLDDATAAMLRRLAVAGDDLDPVSVPALTGLAEPDAFALLDAALGAGALVVSGARYRFRHDLVRQALVEQVPPHHRIAIHRDTARGLAAAAARPALVARHWLRRRPPGRGGSLAAGRGSAGRRARRVRRRARRTSSRCWTTRPSTLEALRLRAEVLDALGDGRAPAAYAAAARVAGGPQAQDLRAMQALAQIKQGDPRVRCGRWTGCDP